MKQEDSISDFRKILMFATKTPSDCRNPVPLMQNYMIKSVKMTKKSILRDQFSWKVRNFAQAFRKGCRSFCCSISPTNYHLARRKNEQIMYNGVMRTSADFALVHDGCGRPVGDKVWGLRFLYAHTDSPSPGDCKSNKETTHERILLLRNGGCDAADHLLDGHPHFQAPVRHAFLRISQEEK